jgi:hypothetical protein
MPHFVSQAMLVLSDSKYRTAHTTAQPVVNDAAAEPFSW